MKSFFKNFVKSALIAGTVILIMSSCAKRKPDKTIANLKAAYIEEVSQIDRYNKYALKAADEKFDKIALMFNALAKSEVVQARNFKHILDSLGVVFEAPTLNSEARSTFENLLDSYKSETYDIQVSYPQFIQDAEDENVPNAEQVFKWSMNGDKEHMGYYYVALTALGTKDQETMPAAWYVCPRCSATYAQADVKDPCPICGTPESKFFEFK